MWQPMEEYDDDACRAIETNLRAPSVLYSSSGEMNEVGGHGSWLPLGAMDVLWYYNGRGVIPQGYLDPAEELIPELLHTRHDLHAESQAGVDDRGDSSAARQFELVTIEVLEAWSDGSRIAPLRLQQIWRDILSGATSTAAAGHQPPPHDHGLTDAQVWWPGYSSEGLVPLRLWMEFAVEGDPEGMLNCDIGYQYNSRSFEEERAMVLAATTWKGVADGSNDRQNSVVSVQETVTASGATAASPEAHGEERLWYDDAFVTMVPLEASKNANRISGAKHNAFAIRTGGNSSAGDVSGGVQQHQDSLRVLVVDDDAPSWVPSGGVSACDGGWKEMSAAHGLETNSYSCHFNEDVAVHMLRSFLRATLPAMQDAFGVTRCEHRDVDRIGLPRKAFTTLLSRCDCS